MADENVPNPAPNPASETFSKEYVAELRRENSTYRQRAIEHETKSKATEEALAKAQAEADAKADAKIAEISTAAEQRIIRAELKAAAKEAGMVDLDGLKMADLSGVKLNKDGEIEGVDELMKGLKESKPYLFGTPNTSSTAKPPDGKPPVPKKATEMSKEEYAKAKAALIK